MRDIFTLDSVLKVTTLLAAIFGLYKILSELISRRREKLRTDYTFAEKFMTGNKWKDIHDYLLELGYEGLSGVWVNSSVIRFFLLQDNSFRMLSDYTTGKRFLDIKRGFAGRLTEVNLKKPLNSPSKFRWKERILFVRYFLYSFLCVFPIFSLSFYDYTVHFNRGSYFLFFFVVVWILYFGLCAYIEVMKVKSLKAAERQQFPV